MIPGRATPEGTRRYAARFPDLPAGHFRESGGLHLSSIGLGTYLGDMTDADDVRYEAAAEAALLGGLNVLDGAINYRGQRSERAIGRAVTRLVATGALARDEIVVATKGGFLPFDGERPADPTGWLRQTWIEPGLVPPGELAAGCHCMAPDWLADQVDRSRRNLGIETIDIYYIHNPETQLDEVDRDEFDRRLAAAFGALEAAADAGSIAGYGLATWDGFRAPPGDPARLELARIAEIARAAGGAGHRFAFAQLPLNLAMAEAWLLPNQETPDGPAPFLAAATRLGLTVMTSASIGQGRLARGLSPLLAERLPGLADDAARALQVVRSIPGVATALVGMKRPEHVAASLALARTPPLSAAALQLLRQQ
jgi:aryl-alcohol dehydrogenase-like predicted oxidoreductase